MKNYFLLEDILFEGRLDDIKNKYKTVPAEIIDSLSEDDPSGNNKYLEFLVKNYSKTSTLFNDNLIQTVQDFHKNLSKIDAELLKDIAKRENFIPYLDPLESSPVGKTIKKVYKAPKDIMSYFGTGGISLMETLVKYAKQKLTKSEVKKLEANILYDSPDLLIVIPESHRASCYYGAGTKWCTTNKESDSHFRSYTRKGTLFYVIQKKEPQSNPWYRTAILVNEIDGTVEAFDAPDNPTRINVASEKLGDKWATIRDVIVDYLYQINSKGIPNLYTGIELLTWYKSKGIDPLKVLSPRALVEKIGVNILSDYLKERNINLFSYFDYDDLLILFGSTEKVVDYETLTAKIWQGYKDAGINPLTTMFNLSRKAEYVIDAIEAGKISLDDFLNLINDSRFLSLFGENQNLFTILTYLYGSGGWTGSSVYQKLMRIFGDNIDLVWGYAKNFGINIFTDLDTKTINGLLKRKFKQEEALEYVFKNLDSVKDQLISLGFSNEEVLNYVNKSENKEKLLNYLISNNLLNKLKIEDYITLGKSPEEAFLNYFNEKVSDSDEAKYFLNQILEDEKGETLKKVFKNYENFKNFIENKTDFNINVDTDINKKTILKVFYGFDHYAMYSDFLKLNKENELNDIFLIKAYDDAPVDEKSGLKEKILNIAEQTLKGTPNRLYLQREDDTFYVFTGLISYLGDFFKNSSDAYYVLETDKKNINTYVEGEYSNLLENKDVRYMVNEYLMLYRNKKIIMDLEFVDDFDYWAENINDDDGTFSFILYDEIILSLEPYLLEILIKNAPIFNNLNKLFKKAYNNAFETTVIEYAKDVTISEIENVFGDDYSRQKTIIFDKKEKSGLQFRYDFLLDDIIAYVNHTPDFEDEKLPGNVKWLIESLMEGEVGRFKNGYIDTDFEYLLDSYYPDEDHVIRNFVLILEEKIEEIE
jgi:hypothetical protein